MCKRVWTASTAAVLAGLMALPAAGAQASKVAHGHTRAMMDKAAVQFAASHSVYTSVRAIRTRISTADRRWGAVTVMAPDRNRATVLLHRRHGRWHAETLGTAFGCSTAPKRILDDLVGGCS